MHRFKSRGLFIAFFLLALCHVEGTEYQPWLGNIYEFELRTSLIYQDYTWLASGTKLKKYSSNDIFLNASLSNALSNIGVELEATQARTRRQRGIIDHLKLTGRYVWLDDIAGDPLSLTFGLSYIQAFKPSLKDVSSFHHGRYEGELFVSAGQEAPLETEWGSRWWGMLGLGVAERGSPWLRFHASYEKRLCDHQEMQLFLRSLWGLGQQKLHLRDFDGYGSIHHQSVDIGLRYTYLLQYFGSASLEYAYRVHGYNFPIYAHRVMAQLFYTFGL